MPNGPFNPLLTLNRMTGAGGLGSARGNKLCEEKVWEGVV
jgi:hypothetical protein